MDVISKYFPELQPKVANALKQGVSYEEITQYVIDKNPKFQPFRKRLKQIFEKTGDVETTFKLAKELYLNHLKLKKLDEETQRYKEGALSLTNTIKETLSGIAGTITKPIADVSQAAGEKYAELEQEYPTTTSVINAAVNIGKWTGVKAINFLSLPHTIPAFISHTIKGKYSPEQFLDALKGIATLSREESFGEDLGISGIILDMALDWFVPGVAFKHITKAGKIVNALKKAGLEEEFLIKGANVFSENSKAGLKMKQLLQNNPKLATEVGDIIMGKKSLYARGLINLKGEVVKRLPEELDTAISTFYAKLNKFIGDTFTTSVSTFKNLKFDNVDKFLNSLGAAKPLADLKDSVKVGLNKLKEIGLAFKEKVKTYDIDNPTNPLYDVTDEGAGWFLKQVDDLGQLAEEFHNLEKNIFSKAKDTVTRELAKIGREKFEQDIYKPLKDITESLNNTYLIARKKWEQALTSFVKKTGLVNLSTDEFNAISKAVEELGAKYQLEGVKRWKDVETFVNRYKDIFRATAEVSDVAKNIFRQLDDWHARYNIFSKQTYDKIENILIKANAPNPEGLLGDYFILGEKTTKIGGQKVKVKSGEFVDTLIKSLKDLRNKKIQTPAEFWDELGVVFKEGEMPKSVPLKQVMGDDINALIQKLEDYKVNYITGGKDKVDNIYKLHRKLESPVTLGDLPDYTKLKPEDKKIVDTFIGQDTYKKAQAINKMLNRLFEVRSAVTGEVPQLGYLRRAVTDEFKLAAKNTPYLEQTLNLGTKTDSPFEHNLFTAVSRKLRWESVKIPEPFQEEVGHLLGMQKVSEIPLFPVKSLAEKNPELISKEGILNFIKQLKIQIPELRTATLEKRHLATYEINQLAESGELFPMLIDGAIKPAYQGKIYKEEVVQGLWDVFMDMPKFQVIDKMAQALRPIGSKTKIKDWLTPAEYFKAKGWLKSNNRVRNATLKIITSDGLLGDKYYPRRVLDHFFNQFTAVSFDMSQLVNMNSTDWKRVVRGLSWVIGLPLKFIRQKMGSSFSYHGANIMDGLLKNIRLGVADRDLYKKSTELYLDWLSKTPNVLGSEYHTELAKLVGGVRKAKKIVFHDVFGKKLYGNTLLAEMRKYGVIGTGRANTETIEDLAKLIVGINEKNKDFSFLPEKLAKVIKNIYGWEGSFIGDNMRAFGQLGEEMLARVPMYVHYRMLGYPAKDAAQAVWQAHFRWDALTSTEAKVWRKIIPFYNFFKNNSLFWAKVATQHPEALGVVKDMSELVGYMTYALQDKSYNQYIVDKSKGRFNLKGVPPFFEKKLRLYTQRIDSAIDFMQMLEAVANSVNVFEEHPGANTIGKEIYSKLHPSLQALISWQATGKLPYSNLKVNLLNVVRKYGTPKMIEFIEKLFSKPYQALGGMVIKQQR